MSEHVDLMVLGLAVIGFFAVAVCIYFAVLFAVEAVQNNFYRSYFIGVARANDWVDANLSDDTICSGKVIREMLSNIQFERSMAEGDLFGSDALRMKELHTELWIVGKNNEPDTPESNNWELQGIFIDKELALEQAMKYESHYVWVSKLSLNKAMPEHRCDWELLWYPKLESEPNNEVHA